MSLAAGREAYLRLANHSMENSNRIAPNLNIRSPKAYGGYIVSCLKYIYFYRQGN